MGRCPPAGQAALATSCCAAPAVEADAAQKREARQRRLHHEDLGDAAEGRGQPIPPARVHRRRRRRRRVEGPRVGEHAQGDGVEGERPLRHGAAHLLEHGNQRHGRRAGGHSGDHSGRRPRRLSQEDREGAAHEATIVAKQAGADCTGVHADGTRSGSRGDRAHCSERGQPRVAQRQPAEDDATGQRRVAEDHLADPSQTLVRKLLRRRRRRWGAVTARRHRGSARKRAPQQHASRREATPREHREALSTNSAKTAFGGGNRGVGVARTGKPADWPSRATWLVVRPARRC